MATHKVQISTPEENIVSMVSPKGSVRKKKHKLKKKVFKKKVELSKGESSHSLAGNRLMSRLNSKTVPSLGTLTN